MKGSWWCGWKIFTVEDGRYESLPSGWLSMVDGCQDDWKMVDLEDG